MKNAAAIITRQVRCIVLLQSITRMGPPKHAVDTRAILIDEEVTLRRVPNQAAFGG
jgi:hypothetical protein